MGFLKRLFGLGSKPTTEDGAAEWAARLLGLPATERPAADWAAVDISNLPPPAHGFTWHAFKEAQITVLQPDGWFVHQQVMDNNIFTGCVSKESIETEGRFITGLTVNAFRGLKEGMRQAIPNCHPDTAVVGPLAAMLPSFFSDPRFEILYLDPCVQRTAASRLARVRYRQLAPAMPNIPWHGPLIVQRFNIEFDQSADVYLLTFESPESAWHDSWKIGKQILTNLVFSPSPPNGLLFSIDPPLAPEDLLRAKVLEVGRSLGWPLAHEDRAKGLFIWRIELEVSSRRQPPLKHAGTFTWSMKRVGNEIKLYDAIDMIPSNNASVDFMAAISAAGRALQEDFKRRWLALVGPVTLQPASPEMIDLCVKAAIQVAQATGALPNR